MIFKLTPRLDSGLKIAAYAHGKANQYRKGGREIPYIMHPFTVMSLLTNITDDEDILIAALLHDVLEDVDSSIISAEEIKDKFGDRVLSIIKTVSKNPNIKDWRQSSEAYIEQIQKSGSVEAITVALADKSHNLFSTLLDYDEIGDEVWQRFTTKSKSDQIWFYKTLEHVFESNIPPSSLLETYQSYIKRLESI